METLRPPDGVLAPDTETDRLSASAVRLVDACDAVALPDPPAAEARARCQKAQASAAATNATPSQFQGDCSMAR